MRYEAIPKSLFIKNRSKLIRELHPNGMAILCSNDVIPSNADGILGFKQNSNLYYLSGIDQEETYLVLRPKHPIKKNREVLFIRETNDYLKIWEGEKLSKKQAREISGVQNVKWSHQLEDFLDKNIDSAKMVYLDGNDHSGRNRSFISQTKIFNKWIKKQFIPRKIKKLSPILTQLRMIKEVEEIDAIKNALEISKTGLLAFAQKLKAGVLEYELEAELTYQFLMHKSRGHAFQPIVASGKNACVLHYVSNNEMCRSGELVLLDFGAEYANYNADISRCFPVNGKFSARQKQVYMAVLNVFQFAKSKLIPGNTMKNLRIETESKMEEELINLGLISSDEIANQNPKKPAYKNYFPHGVSHFLGLDVHDVGTIDSTFEAGMVLTCEPGIYIQEENIGVRIENDILITEDGNIDLAENFPIEVNEIEDMMKHQISNE